MVKTKISLGSDSPSEDVVLAILWVVGLVFALVAFRFLSAEDFFVHLFLGGILMVFSGKHLHTYFIKPFLEKGGENGAGNSQDK